MDERITGILYSSDSKIFVCDGGSNIESVKCKVMWSAPIQKAKDIHNIKK